MSELLPRDHRWLLVVYVAVAVVDVVGGQIARTDILGTALTPVLLALLILWVLLARGRRAPRLLLAGMMFAWLGDLALDGPGDLRFILGIALFLVMQVCYSMGFVGLGALGRLRRRIWLPIGAAALWLGLNIVLGPMLGDMRWPLAVYSAALVTMATLSLGVSPRVGTGGVLFLVSDLLIGLDAAGIDVPLRHVLVIGTYAAAQLLIVTGWVERVDDWDGIERALAARRA
ncbi:MAG TPA: lysoplasmalogenase [Candidatus Nanopelagicales bacterium]|nr:lysoplasmalogenase [Candidatus Nanopelagicales bacterium]